MVALKASFVALSLLGLAAARPGGYGGGGNGYGSSDGSSSSSCDTPDCKPPSDNSGGYSPPQDNSYSSSSSSYSMESSSMMMESSMIMESSSTMMMETTSMYAPPPMETSMMESMTMETSSMMMESSMEMPPPSQTSMTEMPPPSYTSSSAEYMPPMPSYGSGSNNWGNSGYNDCVQQCMASYGPPPSMYTPPPMSEDDKKGMGSSGKMWNVVVAPKKGVFRMVPFAMNVSVGDTVRFMWGADGHTVTQGSELKICNKTDASGAFDSQKQNQGFTFEQTIKDTNPVFFFCSVATHCEKGMFGIINPPSAPGSPTSVDMMMQSTYMKDETMAPMISNVMSACKDNQVAANWGKDFDMSVVPDESKSEFMMNVLLTRYTMAKNPDLVNGNTLNPATPMAFTDITTLAAASDPAAANNAASGPGSDTSSSGASSASSANPTDGKKSGSPRSVAVSSSGVAVVVAAALLFL